MMIINNDHNKLEAVFSVAQLCSDQTTILNILLTHIIYTVIRGSESVLSASCLNKYLINPYHTQALLLWGITNQSISQSSFALVRYN